MDINRLDDLFPPQDIEWRVGQCGTKKDGQVWCKCLPYITNRAIRSRLDSVCGKFGWKNEFREWQNGAQLCGLSIYNKDKNEWITKWDGAEQTNIESIKGGLSDAMKRAGYQLGIGDYLYKLPETFVKTSLTRIDGWKYSSPTKNTPAFYWEIPQLPAWAIPKTSSEPIENKTEDEPIKPKDEKPKELNKEDERILEIAKKLKEIAGDKWVELKMTMKENYHGIGERTIIQEQGEVILKTIKEKGLDFYLNDIPF